MDKKAAGRRLPTGQAPPLRQYPATGGRSIPVSLFFSFQVTRTQKHDHYHQQQPGNRGFGL